MRAVRIVLGEKLLSATDRAARRRRVNRSAFVREALREHLSKTAAREREERDRAGYEALPVEPGEFDVWDKVILQ